MASARELFPTSFGPAMTVTPFGDGVISRWRGGARSLARHEANYDGRLRHLDAALDGLFESLEAMGRLANTTVVVVGSMGTQFGEAGRYLTSGGYSMADLHVPWIVAPAREHAGNNGLHKKTRSHRNARQDHESLSPLPRSRCSWFGRDAPQVDEKPAECNAGPRAADCPG